MKYYKSDYPWSVIYEDKFSSRTGKQYGSTAVAYKSVKDKNATGKDKYETKYLNFFEPADLLKLGALCFLAYREILEQKNAERLAKPQTAEERAQAEKVNPAEPFIDDDIPF